MAPTPSSADNGRKDIPTILSHTHTKSQGFIPRPSIDTSLNISGDDFDEDFLDQVSNTSSSPMKSPSRSMNFSRPATFYNNPQLSPTSPTSSSHLANSGNYDSRFGLNRYSVSSTDEESHQNSNNNNKIYAFHDSSSTRFHQLGTNTNNSSIDSKINSYYSNVRNMSHSSVSPTSPSSSVSFSRKHFSTSQMPTDHGLSVSDNNDVNTTLPPDYSPVTVPSAAYSGSSRQTDMRASNTVSPIDSVSSISVLSESNDLRRSSAAASGESLTKPIYPNPQPRSSSLTHYNSDYYSSSSTDLINSDRSGGGLTSSQAIDRHKSIAVTRSPDNHLSSTTGKPSKSCRKCGLPISGQFVRALNAAYHIDCFACADCGQLCSSKFFPVDVPTDQIVDGTTQIPLCEKDYFKRLELLCYVCDGALRGSYITALGRKYHVEHFTCSMCSTVFGPDDSYYEYEDSIYCHFHYSTLFASKCEGCQTSILKQFVEIYRGGRKQQWHPECYMIFKFWNVRLSPEGSNPSINPLRPLSCSASVPVDELTRDDVLRHEHEVDNKVFRIWTILCGYEETTAAYISDMLQYASSGKFNESLTATTKLVSKIEILFEAIATLSLLIDPIIKRETGKTGESNYSKLGKEARTLCKKVVGFMSLISKSREQGVKKMGITQELLNLVTSLAHYLKLLIRYGLSNSLQYDRLNVNGKAVKNLLDKIATHEDTTSNSLSNLGVTAMTSDCCLKCGSSIEDRCIKLDDRRWHLGCMVCGGCQRALATAGDDVDFETIRQELSIVGWNQSTKQMYCRSCSNDQSAVDAGFEVVSKLQQFIFLLKIAVARLQLVLGAYDSRDKKAKLGKNDATPRQSEDAESSSESSTNKRYMTTLTDIRRLRSTKLDRQLSESSRKARRSRVLDMPDSEVGQMSKSFSFESSSDAKDTHVDKKRSKKKKTVKIEDEIVQQHSAKDDHQRTTDLFNNERSLTLDDIPRIVAAEQAREQRPNAYRHQSRHSSTNLTPERRTVTSTRRETSKKYISELSPMELFAAKHFAVLLIEKMVPEWFTLDELLDTIEVRKTPSIWEKFGKAFGSGGGSADKIKNKKKTGVFGVSLDSLVEKYGVDSTLGVGPEPLRIPSFIDDCILAMRQKDMTIEGVFRKNGNIRRLKEFTEKIDKNPDKSELLAEENPVQLAALLKKFLRELPEPLMTSKLQKLWIAAQKFDDVEQKKRLLHLTCCLLPKTHRDVLEVLFYFLNWTASFSYIDEDSGSKMDAHNLATVITPNILYIKQKEGSANANAESGDAYFLSIESVYLMIEEQSLFAEVPQEILTILQHTNVQAATSDITSKEIITRYEQFMKDKDAQAIAGTKNNHSRQNSNQPSTPVIGGSGTQNGGKITNGNSDGDFTASHNTQAAVPTSSMLGVDTIPLSGSRPGAIRVNTELAQSMAQNDEKYTMIRRVQSPSASITSSPEGGEH